MTGSSPIPTRELTFENHNYVTSLRHHLKTAKKDLIILKYTVAQWCRTRNCEQTSDDGT